jgi:hypothetical protein
MDDRERPIPCPRKIPHRLLVVVASAYRNSYTLPFALVCGDRLIRKGQVRVHPVEPEWQGVGVRHTPGINLVRPCALRCAWNRSGEQRQINPYRYTATG